MPLICTKHFSGKVKAITLRLQKSCRSLKSVVYQQETKYSSGTIFSSGTKTKANIRCIHTVTTLLKLLETCAFGELRESLVRDRLVYGIRDDQVREKLLGKRQLDLDKCIEILKSSELTHYQVKEIFVDEAQTNYVRRDRQKFNEGLKNKGSGSVKHTKLNSRNATKCQKETTPTSEEIKDCQFCGRCHQNKKEMCPAWENGVECARKSDILGKCVDHRKYTKLRKNSKMSSI